ELAKPVPPLDRKEIADAPAKRQAQAALSLLRLGQPDLAWPVLRHRPQPSTRSYFIHLVQKLGADPRLLARRFDEETDVSARRALLLCLGEFPRESLPSPERERFLARLREDYRDHPDPGLHSALDWLLRQRWGQAVELDQIDQQLAGQPCQGRHWERNRLGDTLAHLRGPVEFLMGDPLGTRVLDSVPLMHRRRIPRSFAVATREVTLAQFQQFRQHYPTPLTPLQQLYGPEPNCPVLGVTWFEAARYCRWLSEQEGIPEADMCYPPVSEIKPGMKLSPGHLSRTGYRLPTEAEWEYACRAGSITPRAYGFGETLLPAYAWYLSTAQNRVWPGGLLRPNDFGLFDMYGNVWEWCHDRGPAPTEIPPEGNVHEVHLFPHSSTLGEKDPSAGYVFTEKEDLFDEPDATKRVTRGGSFLYHAPFVRSAKRYRLLTNGQDTTVGFRVARTLREPGR
ncbi:MAG: formylglycine-generating enzyme family protein, partial [Gemmataceae bacterium]|nr:formylglycine-generating enzyme family protein [Gemmataceae bacterium]